MKFPFTFVSRSSVLRPGVLPLAVAAHLALASSLLAGAFVRSDTNGDGRIEVADAIGTFRFLFIGESELRCEDAADVNDDGRIEIADGIQTLRFLFFGGNEPRAPFPLCGVDSSEEDGLGCAVGVECEGDDPEGEPGVVADPEIVRRQSLAEYKSTLPCPPEYEPQPCRPGRPCRIEVRMEQITVTEGQGLTEGKLELNVIGSAQNGDSVAWPSEAGTQEIKVGNSKTIDRAVTTFTLGPNQVRQLEVCTEVTEVDNGGINGDSDIGEECVTVTVSCGMAPRYVTLRPRLCRGGDVDLLGQCEDFNGRVSVEFSIKTEDADCDGVPNLKDFTPDPCDEANLGQRGRALLIYFNFMDGGLRTLVQELGVNLKKAMEGYEYIVLIKDDTDFLGLPLSAQAVTQANLVLEPTTENFWYGFRDIVSKGYSLDVYHFSHGGIYTDTGGAWFETLDGVIDADLVRASLGDPAVTGTRAIPIVMGYSIACFFGRMSQAWLDVGAKSFSAAEGYSFYPTTYGPFVDEWNANKSHGDSIDSSELSANRGIVELFIGAESLPVLTGAAVTGDLATGCVPVVMGVLEENDCAEWYFENGAADAGGAYDFRGDYDANESGLTNMRRASTRILRGDGRVTKGGVVTW